MAGRSICFLLLLALSASASAQTRVDRTFSLQPSANATVKVPEGAIIPSSPAQSATPQQASPPVTTGAPHAAPSGAYTSDAMGATIVAKNADYETIFKINVSIPAGSRISNVSWRYGVSGKPTGFEAVLCGNMQQRCWNVTNNPSGSTTAFNGRDATQPFSLHYRVTGGGPLGPPVQGQMNQIIIAYDLPG